MSMKNDKSKDVVVSPFASNTKYEEEIRELSL